MNITNEKELNNYEQGIKREWLVANGLGGYASSTIIGLNTRKYHGLLIAALDDSQERYLVLPKVAEEIFDGKDSFSFSSNECPNFIEKGYKYQKCFAKDYVPEFLYNVNGTEIIKKIAMCHGKNKVAITYTIKTDDRDVKLKLSPLINFRNFHTVKDFTTSEQTMENNILKVKLNEKHNLYIATSECEYTEYHNTYYKNMYYATEFERGLEHIESHFMPGFFEFEVAKNSERVIEFVASVDDEAKFNMKANASQIIKGEEARLQKYIKMADVPNDDEVEKDLVISADSFIIDKKYGKAIIAGYHWFGDWGRDTFISLEGLLLKNNRFSDAKNIINTYANHIKNGLVPNLIGEDGGEAFNSVDASLWFIYAINKYYKYTNDKEFVKAIYPKMMEIIDAYKNGTLYDIKMDKDGLISAGNENTQLTWMDAKIGDYIPTPRYGKAVEVNCLWYNALNIADKFSKILDIPFDSSIIEQVRKSFEKFYLDHGLKDTIEPTNLDIRPNQVFAVALEYPIVDTDKANDIVDIVEEELLTTRGLRTLSPKDPKYKPRYVGDVLARDSSYHQGTVWPWLFIGYGFACFRLHRKPKVVSELDTILYERCIGGFSEIYDAEEPRLPNGAITQAWSIAMASLL